MEQPAAFRLHSHLEEPHGRRQREVATGVPTVAPLMGVRYRCHSPVPSGQSVRMLSEIPTLGSDRSGVGATLDLPFFRRHGLPVRLIRPERGWMLSCVRGRGWLAPLLSAACRVPELV